MALYPMVRKSRLGLVCHLFAVLLWPLSVSGNQLMAHGIEVSIGDSVETLVKRAGRPHSVEHDFGCIGSGCELQGFLEKWIFVHGDTRYRVGVFRDQVTSIEYEPLQQAAP